MIFEFRRRRSALAEKIKQVRDLLASKKRVQGSYGDQQETFCLMSAIAHVEEITLDTSSPGRARNFREVKCTETYKFINGAVNGVCGFNNRADDAAVLAKLDELVERADEREASLV